MYISYHVVSISTTSWLERELLGMPTSRSSWADPGQHWPYWPHLFPLADGRGVTSLCKNHLISNIASRHSHRPRIAGGSIGAIANRPTTAEDSIPPDASQFYLAASDIYRRHRDDGWILPRLGYGVSEGDVGMGQESGVGKTGVKEGLRGAGAEGYKGVGAPSHEWSGMRHGCVNRIAKSIQYSVSHVVPNNESQRRLYTLA